MGQPSKADTVKAFCEAMNIYLNRHGDLDEFVVRMSPVAAKEIVSKLDTMGTENVTEEEPVDPRMRWIPCSEKNGPSRQAIVLVTVPAHTDEEGVEHDPAVVCAYTIRTPASGTMWFRSDGDTFGCLGRLEPDPIAWMPLPDPYDREWERN